MLEKNNQINQYYWNFLFSLLFVVLVALSLRYFESKGSFPERIEEFDFILIILATFRLIRLFVYDSVTDYIRDYLSNFESGPRKTLSNLISCPWCTGVWMAFFIVFFYFYSPLFWLPMLILAVAGAGSFIQVTINRIGR